MQIGNLSSKKTSQTGIDLIKNFEGLALTPYACSAGHNTIGYGHVIMPNENYKEITQEQADDILKRDLERFERGVNQLVNTPLNQSEFDALISFSFNVGLANFANSTLLRLINSKQYLAAAEQFLKWDKYTNPKTGKKESLAGLARRRQAERKLFLGG